MTPSADDRALADAIPVTASRFEAIFNKAKPRDSNLELHALPDEPVSQTELIAHGLARARADDWLDALLNWIVAEGFCTQELIDAMKEQRLAEDNAALQSVRNVMRGFGAPAVAADRIARIMRQVCRIDVFPEGANPTQGTGFLVRSDLVMTAFHVIRDLLEDDGATIKPDSIERLKVVFDDYQVVRLEDHRDRLPGRVVRVADDWLVATSACHDKEIEGALPEDLIELIDLWDYAIIRLDGIAGVGLDPVCFQNDRRLMANAHIAIYQHPDGRAQSFDTSNVVEILENDVRFHHEVNTEGGSSGAPCFDEEYKVIGMHQAGPRNGPSRSINVVNRGVPTFHLPARLAELPKENPRLFPLAELSETKPGEPVFGRTRTQDWVWDELERTSEAAEEEPGQIADKRPILVINGYPHQGKSFTYHILRSMLPRSDHDVIKLKANILAPLTPEAFTDILLGELEYDFQPLPVFEADSARAAWLSHTLMPELMSRLERGRDGKGVWIVIDDIEKAPLASESEISNFLYALYEQTIGVDWLHFVLLGYDGSPPVEVAPYLQSEDLVLPDDEDYLDYLRIKTPPKLQRSLDEMGPTIIALIRSSAGSPQSKGFLPAFQKQIVVALKSMIKTGESDAG